MLLWSIYQFETSESLKLTNIVIDAPAWNHVDHTFGDFGSEDRNVR